MKEIKGSIDIDAPVEKVWRVITDFPAYPQWNPFVTRMNGELKEGKTFEVTTRSPGMKEMKFNSELRKVVTNREMLFHGTIKKNLLEEDHLITVEPLGENKSRLFQSIIFHGFLRFFLGSKIKAGQKGLDTMNSAAKVRSEAPGR